MPIEFSCSCGKKYSVDESMSGKRTKCPVCKAALVVPIPPPEELGEFELVEDEDDEVVEDFDYVDDEPEVVVATANANDIPTVKSIGFARDSISEHTLVYACGIGGTYVYRLIRVGNELLFLDAGPHFQGLNSAESASAGGVAGSGEGGFVGGMIAASLAGTVAALDEIKQAKAEKRAEKLDKMSADKLRAEVGKGIVSFRAKAEDLSDVRFDKPTFFSDNHRPSKNTTGVLRFTHETNGEVRLYLIQMSELKKAVYLFVDILGAKAVTVNLPVRKKRKK